MFIQDYTLRQKYVHACLLTNVTFRLQSSYQTLRNVMVNVCQSSVLFGRIYGPQTPLRQKVHPSCSKHWSFTLLEGMYATQNSRYISLPATLFIEDVPSSKLNYLLNYVFTKIFNQTSNLPDRLLLSDISTQDFKKEYFVSKIMILYIYSSAIKGGCNVVIIIVNNNNCN